MVLVLYGTPVGEFSTRSFSCVNRPALSAGNSADKAKAAAVALRFRRRAKSGAEPGAPARYVSSARKAIETHRSGSTGIRQGWKRRIGHAGLRFVPIVDSNANGWASQHHRPVATPPTRPTTVFQGASTELLLVATWTCIQEMLVILITYRSPVLWLDAGDLGRRCAGSATPGPDSTCWPSRATDRQRARGRHPPGAGSAREPNTRVMTANLVTAKR